MYPKNSASPPKIFATVVKAADGTAITSGVAAKYSTGAGSQAAGGGACQHEGNGQWSYAPTQAETNVDGFGIQFYHADAVGTGPTVNVVTTASVVQTGDSYAVVSNATYGNSALASAISAIGSGTGAALNFEVAEDNASAPIKSVTAVGTQTGTYANTLANDGTTHQIASVANAIDWVYGFDVGTARAASKVVLRANMAAVTDTVTVSAYNFVTPGWDTRTTITGTTETTYDIPLLSRNTGTGSDVGKVYIRFVFSETDAGTLVIDEAYVQAQQSGSLIGYQDALIWVDTNGSNTNTVPYVDGTADNPVSTIAAAYTLAAATGLKGIRFLAGSSVTLTQSAANWRFVGAATIALNGQSIADALFRDSYTISGTSTGDDAEFINCGIGTATIAHAYFIDCRFKGTLTMAASNEYFITGGYDAVSSGTCTFVFGANTELMARDWHGGIQLNSMAAGATAIIDGAGRVVIDGSSTGGAITIRGMFAEATGGSTFVAAGGTITDTARWAEDQNVTNVTGAVTGNVGGNVTGSVGSLATQAKADVNAEVVDALATDVIADSVATDGSRPTIAQAVLMITRFLMERSVSSTTVTVNKEDGTTSSMTFTLDSATAPTSITRAS